HFNMFTGELWDPGKAVTNTMALEAQSQAPGSEASTSSGLRPGDRDLLAALNIRRCAVRIRAVPEDPDFDIVHRDEAGQPDLTEAQRKRKASGEARAARSKDNTFHARKATSPTTSRKRFGTPSLTRPDQLHAQGQPLSYTDTDIPVSAADIPDLSCRNLYLQLCRGLPGEGEDTQPSAAVAAVLAAHPDLCARLEAIPRNLSDSNMVDHVGKQLQTAFSNMLTLLFAGRLKKSVSLAGAKVLLGTNEHRLHPDDPASTLRKSAHALTPGQLLLLLLLLIYPTLHMCAKCVVPCVAVARQAGQATVARPSPGTGLWCSWLQWERHRWLQGCPSQPDAEGGGEALPGGILYLPTIHRNDCS
ncbi:hypothetical protein QJQ45_025632, partial [Haematococcus lacustris]